MLTIEKKKKFDKLKIYIITLLLCFSSITVYLFYSRRIIGTINNRTVYLDDKFSTDHIPTIIKIEYPECYYFITNNHPDSANYDLEFKYDYLNLEPYYVFITENSKVNILRHKYNFVVTPISNIEISNDTFDLNFLRVSTECRKGDSLCNIVKNIILELSFKVDMPYYICPFGYDYKKFVLKFLKNKTTKNVAHAMEFGKMLINKQGILIFSNNKFYFYEIADDFIGYKKRIFFDLNSYNQ